MSRLFGNTARFTASAAFKLLPSDIVSGEDQRPILSEKPAGYAVLIGLADLRVREIGVDHGRAPGNDARVYHVVQARAGELIGVLRAEVIYNEQLGIIETVVGSVADMPVAEALSLKNGKEQSRRDVCDIKAAPQHGHCNGG